ncbi:phospholipid carrier-dependent glycosyltransferase [Uliginosibacterium sp. sgz301328]|uniref:phospholipid carrier-dependent glycosyltransferase n=1 Tax=Uliginosibacterium sp. sgz301328 TaxID=3243764 RepID=UPI00359E6B56
MRPWWQRAWASWLLVSVVALAVYFVDYGQPRHLFWDENYHSTSAQRYIEGIAQFEPHPPLALMLIAAGEKLSGANSSLDKNKMTLVKYIGGNDLPEGFQPWGMRLMPTIFAALAAIAFFGLALELTRSRAAALLLSSIYMFENAFIVHFRAIHLDSFQMLFAILFFWQFVRAWRSETPLRWQTYAAMGAVAALALMVKVNGVLLLALFVPLYFRDARHLSWRAWGKLGRDFALKSGSAVAALLLVVWAVFYVHALIGNRVPSMAGEAGRQDIQNMSPAYRNQLETSGAVTPWLVAGIARDYFKFMDKDHLGVPKLDVCKPGENGSYPLSWVVENKNINYRWDSNNGKTSYVQLAGNHLSWLLGLAAVVLALGLMMARRIFGMPVADTRIYGLIEVFGGLYVVFMALHIYLGSQRVMYLYHYFLGLLISYVLVVLLWMYLEAVKPFVKRHRLALLGSLAAVIFVSYAYVSPLTYHWPLSKQQCERENWLHQTVECQG